MHICNIKKTYTKEHVTSDLLFDYTEFHESNTWHHLFSNTEKFVALLTVRVFDSLRGRRTEIPKHRRRAWTARTHQQTRFGDGNPLNTLCIMLRSRLGPGNKSLQNEASRSILTSEFDFVLVTKSTTSVFYRFSTYRPRFDVAWKACIANKKENYQKWRAARFLRIMESRLLKKSISM